MLKFDSTIGPAAVVAVIGTAGIIATNIWIASSNYRGLSDKLDQVSSRTEDVAKGSDTRFQTVYQSLAKTRDAQTLADQRLSRVETAIVYISSQVQRVEAKLDGGPPAPALSAPPKP